MAGSRSSPKKKRGPRHCRKCPGTPLQSQCLHSAAGRAALEKGAVMTMSISTPPDAPPIPDSDSLTSSATTRPSATSAMATPLAVNTAPEALPNSDAICTDGARPSDCFPSISTRASATGSCSSSGPDVTRTTSATGAQRSARFPSTEAAAAGSSSAPDIGDPSAPYVLDMTTTSFQQMLQLHGALEQRLRPPTAQLADELHQSRNNPTCSSPAPNRGASDGDETDMGDLNSDVEEESHQFPSSDPVTPFSSQPSTPSRIRVTAKNPAFGFVEGAMRGNMKLTIRRLTQPRPRLLDRAQITKRYHREIKTLIERCERFSHETGCWLVFTCQHSNSGSAATHFTSANFRRDAKEDAIDMVNTFQKATSALMHAKRTEALGLARQLAEVDEELRALRSQLTERDSERVEADKEVQALRAQLAEKGTSQPRTTQA